MRGSVAKQKSGNVRESGRRVAARPDARAEKTRLKIDRAFVDLLFRRPYASVRVQDIVKKAGVGRATFYAHHESKDALLQSQVERILMPMLRERTGSLLPDCRDLFLHAREAPQLFRSILGSGDNSGARIVRRAIEERLGAMMREDRGPQAEMPAQLARRFVAATLMTTVAHALQPGTRETAEELQGYFEKLAGTGLAG